MDKTPELVPGPAFHLEGDGHWDVQELPHDVVRGSKFTGEIKIDGYPAVVFETKEGDQWAQKSPGTPAPKGDEGSAQVISASFPDPFLRMGKRLVAKVEMEQSTIRSVRGILDELKTCVAALDKAVQHGRSLKNSSSLEWIYDQLESKKEEMSGLAVGIRESVEYLTRVDIED
jgi:hypothetical protein